MTRIVFMGTPDFAVPTLKALVDEPAFEVIAVVTQPDRPAGRGRQVRQPPVKQAALEYSIPVFQPSTLRSDEAVGRLRSYAPDVIVVAAFGQILRQPVLDLPPSGCINVHASLLPRWRGAAPIQYAIRAGDEQSGVTIMKMDAGLDTGPMLASEALPIGKDETGASLQDKLAALGAGLLPPTLSRYLAGDLKPRPQPVDGVTLAPTLRKEEGHIEWNQSAVEIDRLVRAFDPWPGTFSFLGEERIKVLSGFPDVETSTTLPPGMITMTEDGLSAATGRGLYHIKSLQPAGKKAMDGEAFLTGRSAIEGMILR